MSFSRKQVKLTFLCGLLISFAAAVWACFLLGQEPKPSYAEVFTNAADCTAYLLKQGIAVEPTPVVLQQITLPLVSNDAYDNYLQLQKQQGFDLAAYGGKKAALYVYEEASPEGALITLIISEGNLIAADRTLFGISSQALPLS